MKRDIADEETEKVLKEIENQISKEYAQAEKEVAKKLDDYLKKFEVKDELKRKAVANGIISEKEYKEWRIGQIMIGQRWTEMRNTLAQDLTNADKIARSIAFEHMPYVYAINHDYSTFLIEKASLLETSYTLYDRHAMEQLVKDTDTFIPAPGRKVSRDIKEGKALAWNNKLVQSAMMQSLLQGEAIPDIATRLAKTVGDSDRKAAIRNARTLTTGIENAGRIASYKQANDMGIKTRKQWLATLDDRTRHWHASLDGEIVDYDEPFENELGEIMFPGDPAADPGNIFNCRCTLIPSIKGFERDVSDMNLRHDDHLGDMTYDEWKAGKYEQTSDPITKQDTVSEIMNWKYVEDYKAVGNSPESDEPTESFKPSPEEIKAAAEIIKGGPVSYDTIAEMYKEGADKSKIISLTTGADIETAKEYQNVIEAWCGEDYKNIRAFQNGDMSHSSVDGVKQGAVNAHIIEQFIEKSPKWKGGTTYRGISGSEDILDKIRESLHNGSEYSMLGTAAWAFTKDSAMDHAKNNKIPIIFVSQTQKKGTAINAFSQLTYDNEVIVSEKARYQIVDMKQKDGIWWINVRE